MLLVSRSASPTRGCAQGPGSPAPICAGLLAVRRPHHLSVTSVSAASPRAAHCPLCHPLRHPRRGGCDVPSARLSGRQPHHADTCLTCLTRAMPVAPFPCGLCVGRGWGPGLALSGWTAGAWSWNRPPATGDGQAGTGWHQRGWSPPQAELWPTEPESLRLPDRGPGRRGLLRWRGPAPQLLTLPLLSPQGHVRAGLLTWAVCRCTRCAHLE